MIGKKKRRKKKTMDKLIEMAQVIFDRTLRRDSFLPPVKTRIISMSCR